MQKLALRIFLAALTFGFAQPARAGGETSLSSRGVRKFTLDQAIQTALQRNPTLLIAEREIERTKGVIIQVRAEALPHITVSGSYTWTDPNLTRSTSIFGTPTTTGTVAPVVASQGSQAGDVQRLATPTPTPGFSAAQQSEISYNIRVTGTQLVFNGTTWPSIRGTFFQRDSAYFAFRNTLDLLLATVKTQFYQVVVNRELIKVQEQSVHLLETQLKDQQNRFEAGTVPRFNVLQAEVALYNQIPQLIAARNNYRIAQLTLAKTLGLDFDPRRGEKPPLEVVGEMPYNPREILLVDAIELGKQRRPFLKQARANVLNQIEQVHVALGGFLPTIDATGGGEWVSSPFNSSFHDISKGWIAGVTGRWPIWDSGAVYGQVKQQ